MIIFIVYHYRKNQFLKISTPNPILCNITLYTLYYLEHYSHNLFAMNYILFINYVNLPIWFNLNMLEGKRRVRYRWWQFVFMNN